MTEEKKAEFNELALEALTYNGQVYGVPYAIENLVLYPEYRSRARRTGHVRGHGRHRRRSWWRAGKATRSWRCRSARPATRTTCTRSTPLPAATCSARRPTAATTRDLGLADPAAAEAMAKIGEYGETGAGAFKRSISGDNRPSPCSPKERRRTWSAAPGSSRRSRTRASRTRSRRSRVSRAVTRPVRSSAPMGCTSLVAAKTRRLPRSS